MTNDSKKLNGVIDPGLLEMVFTPEFLERLKATRAEDPSSVMMNPVFPSDYQPMTDLGLPPDLFKDGVLDIYSVAMRQFLIKTSRLRESSRTEPSVEINEIIQKLGLQLRGGGKSELGKKLALVQCEIQGVPAEKLLLIDSLEEHAKAYSFACECPDMGVLSDPIDEWSDIEAEEKEKITKLVSRPYSKNARKNPLAFLEDKDNKKSKLLRKNPFFKNLREK